MGQAKVTIRPMREGDLDEVLAIERLSFPTAWPANAFLSEIGQNKLAHYVVAHLERPDQAAGSKLVGYAGVWLVIDEAHITTIAVHPEERGKRIGEQLLMYLLTYSIERNARWATLEVRESNKGAQALYKKFGFCVVGVRKNYYVEEGENAVIMWAGNLGGEGFQTRLAALRRELCEAGVAPR